MSMAANQQTIEFAYMMGRMLVYIIPMIVLVYLIRKSIQLYEKHRIEQKKAERQAEEQKLYGVEQTKNEVVRATGMDDLKIVEENNNEEQ